MHAPEHGKVGEERHKEKSEKLLEQIPIASLPQFFFLPDVLEAKMGSYQKQN